MFFCFCFLVILIDILQVQVVDQHISAETEPQVAEPDHLALVGGGHGGPGGAQLGLGSNNVVGVDERLGVLGVLVAREQG